MIWPPEKSTQLNSEIDRSKKPAKKSAAKKATKPTSQQEAIFRGLKKDGISWRRSESNPSVLELTKDGATVSVPESATMSYDKLSSEIKKQKEAATSETPQEVSAQETGPEPKEVNKEQSEGSTETEKAEVQPAQPEADKQNLGGGIDQSRSIIFGLIETMILVLAANNNTKNLPQIASSNPMYCCGPNMANSYGYNGYNRFNR